MYYSLESFGDKQTRIPIAIQHLQKSMELDSKSGQCLYLLGRCFASIGKVHEAFVAYRTSVDKSEVISTLLNQLEIPHQLLNAKPENVER